jgi:hypothetical protein
MHSLSPNIATMSDASNTSGVAELPKFANEKPSLVGAKPEVTSSPP